MDSFYCRTLLLILSVWMCTVLWIFDHVHHTKLRRLKGISNEEKYTNEIKKHKGIITNKTFYMVEYLHDTMSTSHDVNATKTELLCHVHSNWNTRYFSKKVTTNFSSWTFKEQQNCPNIHILEKIRGIQPRITFSMACTEKHIKIQKNIFENEKLKNNDVLCFPFGDKCLEAYINECCHDRMPVPNILHYVRYQKRSLTFFEFVSFISAIRFIRPCAIMIHGDTLPTGFYWKGILTLSPNIIHVKWEPPDKIFGKKIIYREHAGDIMRIEALLMYGGIYLDTDTVIVKPLDPLRKYSCTMSRQSSGFISSAFIMAEKNATFLLKWMDGYKYRYKPMSYIFNAMEYPKYIYEKFKDHIHIEYGTLSRPLTQIGFKIYNTNFRWGGIYGIHLFSRSYRKPMTVKLVKYFNSTVGSICRHVLFGNKELCFKIKL